MEFIQYNNGPLPASLEVRAYHFANEFALNREDALAYLAWCQKHGFRVTGFEIWMPTLPGPTNHGTAAEGDAAHCTHIISTVDYSERIKSDELSIVYNIWVADTMLSDT